MGIQIWDFSMSVELDMSLSHKHPWPCIILFMDKHHLGLY